MKQVYRPQQLLEWRHERQMERALFAVIFLSFDLGFRQPQGSRRFTGRSPSKTAESGVTRRNGNFKTSEPIIQISLSELPRGTRIIRAAPGVPVPENAIPVAISNSRNVTFLKEGIDRLLTPDVCVEDLPFQLKSVRPDLPYPWFVNTTGFSSYPPYGYSHPSDLRKPTMVNNSNDCFLSEMGAFELGGSVCTTRAGPRQEQSTNNEAPIDENYNRCHSPSIEGRFSVGSQGNGAHSYRRCGDISPKGLSDQLQPDLTQFKYNYKYAPYFEKYLSLSLSVDSVCNDRKAPPSASSDYSSSSSDVHIQICTADFESPSISYRSGTDLF
ncbi:hypothetical protein PUMCH_001370 [Australozyma saopauloensis]|uniref:Uncharacterized protein n=1 Tax=Australozyma saopauloensis TaxID=291208 RepID=A0AAX4H6G1_9ASCO|nr:hypothetical protein PUMCH_001370 [[Candida] saopauloensis]